MKITITINTESDAFLHAMRGSSLDHRAGGYPQAINEALELVGRRLREGWLMGRWQRGGVRDREGNEIAHVEYDCEENGE